MKIKLKKKSIIFIFILLLVFGVGSTFALFYTNVSVPNRYKIMNYDVVLDDEFDNEWGSRNVSISNNDTATDVVIRVSYNELFSKKFDGVTSFISNKIDGKDVVLKGWTDDFKSNFTLGEDGWYYYNKILKTSSTVKIMDSVELDNELISESYDYDNYLRYNYELDFNYEAIKADEENISTVWNKDAKIEGDNVIW